MPKDPVQPSDSALRALIRDAARHISQRDAETLALHVVREDRAWLHSHPEAPLTAAQQRTLQDLVHRRAQGEPLQYLTGQQEFFGLPFQVTPSVLIPRPETELLVEAVLAWVRQSHAGAGSPAVHLADVGTGSGAIAVALAAALPQATVVALDISEPALELAAQNAEALGVRERIRFGRSDLLEQLFANAAANSDIVPPTPLLDVVVSNPPYIPLRDAPVLQPEVRDHEPHLALFGGDDGLALYRRLVPQARQILRPGGLLAMEFGFGQQPALEALLADWEEVHFTQDYAGIPRLVLAERPQKDVTTQP